MKKNLALLLTLCLSLCVASSNAATEVQYTPQDFQTGRVDRVMGRYIYKPNELKLAALTLVVGLVSHYLKIRAGSDLSEAKKRFAELTESEKEIETISGDDRILAQEEIAGEHTRLQEKVASLKKSMRRRKIVMMISYILAAVLAFRGSSGRRELAKLDGLLDLNETVSHYAGLTTTVSKKTVWRPDDIETRLAANRRLCTLANRRTLRRNGLKRDMEITLEHLLSSDQQGEKKVALHRLKRCIDEGADDLGVSEHIYYIRGLFHARNRAAAQEYFDQLSVNIRNDFFLSDSKFDVRPVVKTLMASPGVSAEEFRFWYDQIESKNCGDHIDMAARYLREREYRHAGDVLANVSDSNSDNIRRMRAIIALARDRNPQPAKAYCLEMLTGDGVPNRSEELFWQREALRGFFPTHTEQQAASNSLKGLTIFCSHDKDNDLGADFEFIVQRIAAAYKNAGVGQGDVQPVTVGLRTFGEFMERILLSGGDAAKVTAMREMVGWVKDAYFAAQNYQVVARQHGQDLLCLLGAREAPVAERATEITAADVPTAAQQAHDILQTLTAA